jgi:hypothetical protein
VPRLPGGGKDRADLSNPVRDCWGEETKARSLGVKVSKKKAGCEKRGRRERGAVKRESEERETRSLERGGESIRFLYNIVGFCFSFVI